jgi:tRNA-specific 2-thiouridylase
MDFHPADVVDTEGNPVGRVDAVELVTLGQRRGLGLGGGDKRYAVDVDVPARRVIVGSQESLMSDRTVVGSLVWPHPGDGADTDGREVLVQGSAHGSRHSATVQLSPDGAILIWERPQRRISPGQTVVFYDMADSHVLGGGIVTAH